MHRLTPLKYIQRCIPKGLVAEIRANIWCMWHIGNMVAVQTHRAPKKIFHVITRVEVGKGSVVDGTWQPSRLFYIHPSCSIKI